MTSPALFETVVAREGLLTFSARLRANREAATPTAEETSARLHRTGPKPSRGLSLGELAARYDAARGAKPGTTLPHHVLRWERGAMPKPQAIRCLEQAMMLPRGALDGRGCVPVGTLNSRS